MKKETRNNQITRLYPRMVGLAKKIVSANFAQDVVHETVIYLLSLPESKVITDSWILKATYNRSINFLRDTKRRNDSLVGYLDVTHGDGKPNPEQQSLLHEQTKKLGHAFSLLSYEDRSILDNVYGLSTGHPLTIRQVAFRLSKPPSTVFDRFSRALNLLNDTLTHNRRSYE